MDSDLLMIKSLFIYFLHYTTNIHILKTNKIMRKILLLLLVLFSISFILTAQNFTIKDHNDTDISNTTIDIYGSVSDNELQAELQIVNNGTEDYNVILKKSYISNVTGTINYFCTNMCSLPSTMESNPYPVNAGQSKEFSIHYFPNGNVGNTTIMYTLYNADVMNHSGDSVSITVNYIVTISVNEALSDKMDIYPNPSTGIININNVEGSTVLVYNVLGEIVSSIENANQFNIVDLSAYTNGTYVVKVLTNDNVITKKIVLNR